jgi:hypothetical protein
VNASDTHTKTMHVPTEWLESFNRRMGDVASTRNLPYPQRPDQSSVRGDKVVDTRSCCRHQSLTRSIVRLRPKNDRHSVLLQFPVSRQLKQVRESHSGALPRVIQRAGFAPCPSASHAPEMEIHHPVWRTGSIIYCRMP